VAVRYPWISPNCITGFKIGLPLLGELNVIFKVADHEHAVLVAVTEAVNEYILGINFLSEQCCEWDFDVRAIWRSGVSARSP